MIKRDAYEVIRKASFVKRKRKLINVFKIIYEREDMIWIYRGFSCWKRKVFGDTESLMVQEKRVFHPKICKKRIIEKIFIRRELGVKEKFGLWKDEVKR
ncbi:hypothetical protein COB52_04880 [Candidatus Kaiserbacteria bacterium]|nr:MAG: hypothetical protein COB52_04880 [Candidatus Kaiserbacteria bacterium]